MAISRVTQTAVEPTSQQPDPVPATVRANIAKGAAAIALTLKYPASRSDGTITVSSIAPLTHGGYEVWLRVPNFADKKKTMGEIHCTTDAKGKCQDGFWTVGDVPRSFIQRVDGGGLMGLAQQAADNLGLSFDAIDDSSTIRGIRARPQGQFDILCDLFDGFTQELLYKLEVTVTSQAELIGDRLIYDANKRNAVVRS